MTTTRKATCLRGHNIADHGRYGNGQCRVCARTYARQWKIANNNRFREDKRLDAAHRRKQRIVWRLLDTCTEEERRFIEQHQLMDRLLAWKYGRKT